MNADGICAGRRCRCRAARHRVVPVTGVMRLDSIRVHLRFNYFLIAITQLLWICRAMNVLFHYTAGPDLAARLAAIPGLRITICPEDDDTALARALPETDVLWHVLKRCTEVMLAVLRRIPRFDAGLRAGVWLDPLLQDGIGELGGRVVGLVGYGAIPRLLAPVLVALGCTVIYADQRQVADAVGSRRPLDTLLAEADVVSLHVPLTEETENLIDAA